MNVFDLLTYSILIISIALTVLIILFFKLLRSKGQTWARGAVPTPEEIASEKVEDLAYRLEGSQTKKHLQIYWNGNTEI